MFYTPVVYLTFANPETQKHLSFLKNEQRDVSETLRKLNADGSIIVDSSPAITAKELQTVFTKHHKDRIEIFHYGGHAADKELVLEDTRGHSVGLAGLLALQKQLKLVFLNACSTTQQVDAYLDAGIPAIIYTLFDIDDERAAQFAADFYGALTNDHSIEDAFKSAQSSLRLKGENDAYGIKAGELYPWPASSRGIRRDHGDGSPWKLYVREDREDVRHWRITDPQTARALREGSQAYRKRLMSGRFKHLDISKILIPTLDSDFIDAPVAIENDESTSLSKLLSQLWVKDVPHTLLLGEGGMGKTVSLIELWKQLLGEYSYSGPVPIFIQLNEFNHLPSSETDDQKFVIKSICKHYLGKQSLTPVIEEEIWKLLKTPLTNSDHFIPSVILFLDGFNELPAEKTGLLHELKEIVDKARGTQIVITSRYDMRNFTWTQGFGSTSLMPLSPESVQAYLTDVSKKENIEVSYPERKALQELLCNPMMLSLYATSSEWLKRYGDDPGFDFKPDIASYGELMWNFIEAQVAKIHLDQEINEQLTAHYKFLLRQLLPNIAFSMEKSELFSFSSRQMRQVINEACEQLYSPTLIESFDEYEEHIDSFDLGTLKKLKQGARFKRQIKLLTQGLNMLVEEAGDGSEQGSYRFLHQHFRDFFAATHILNDISIALDQELEPTTMKERVLPNYLRRIIGQVAREHSDKPNVLLANLLDSYRHIDTATDPGFSVYNLIRTFHEVRKDLSSLSLANLDLRGIHLNGMRFFQNTKQLKRATVFDGSLLSLKEQFLPHGHRSAITDICFGGSDRVFFTASDDASIKQWNVETGHCIRTFTGHSASVSSITYDLQQGHLISASHNGELKIWNVKTGQSIHNLDFPDSDFNSIAYNSIGQFIVAVGELKLSPWDEPLGPTLFVLDATSNKILWSKQHGGIRTVACHPDKPHFFSGSQSGTIDEWKLHEQMPIRSFKAPSPLGTISNITLSDDGQFIAASAVELETQLQCVHIWSHTGRHINRLCPEPPPAHFTFSPDNTYLLMDSMDGLLQYGMESTESIQLYSSRSRITGVTFIPGRWQFLSGHWDGSWGKWDLSTGELLFTMEASLSGVGRSILSEDQKTLCCQTFDKMVKQWTVGNSICFRTINGSLIGDITLSHNSQMFIKSDNGDYQLIDTLTGQKSDLTIDIDDFDLFDAAGQMFLMSSYDESKAEQVVSIWNCTSVDNGLKKFTLPTTLRPRIIKISSDGKYFARVLQDFGERGSLEIRTISNAGLVSTVDNIQASVHSLCFHPTKKRIIYGTGDWLNPSEMVANIIEWDFDAHRFGRTLHEILPPTSLIYSKDGNSAFSASEKRHRDPWINQEHNSIRIWSLENDSQPEDSSSPDYVGHTAEINDLFLSKNGQYLISSSSDGTTKIWEVDSRQCLDTISNVPCLLIHGCSFKNLHPDSEMNEEEKEIMRQYGAIFNDEDERNWQEVLDDVYGEGIDN